jgi:hypothetical protein
MQHTMEKNTLTIVEGVPVLLWVPRFNDPSRSKIMLASMTAGFVDGVLGEISGKALFFFLNNENLVNKKTLSSRMFLWCLAIVLWLVVTGPDMDGCLWNSPFYVLILLVQMPSTLFLFGVLWDLMSAFL